MLALLLANLAFFAWTRLHTQADREPDRQAKQVRPEAVRLLPPGSASAASAADSSAASASAVISTSCFEAGPFSTAEVAAAEAALAASPAASSLAQRWSRISDERPGAPSASPAVQHLRIDAATPDEAATIESLPAGLLTHAFAPCMPR